MSLYLGDNLISNSISVPYNWSGTLAEYANLPEIHEDWIYCITDDVPPTTEIYSKTEVNTLLNGKAGTDLSNLSATGEKHFVNKQQITNCILEDPQKIILSLNNGTLTLHAGSVVCVPNGFESDGVTPKFDEVSVSSDITYTDSYSETRMMFFENNGIDTAMVSKCYSGSSAPTGFGQYAHWYDTTNNLVKRTTDSGSTWTTGFSLPYSIVTSNTTQITSIDQTFQSIGYIGSTVFIRKGLKVLIPDGRNTDGSLKNIEHILSKTITYTDSDTRTNLGIALLNNETLFTWAQGAGNGRFYYNSNANKYFASEVFTQMICIGTCDKSSGTISNFNPYTAANILKYSDSSQISGWGMPSTKFIGLTYGASGATYVAPANGWYYVWGTSSSSSGAYFNVYTVEARITQDAYNADKGLAILFPVKKGAQVGISYGGSFREMGLRFVYSEGEQ